MRNPHRQVVPLPQDRTWRRESTHSALSRPVHGGARGVPAASPRAITVDRSALPSRRAWRTGFTIIETLTTLAVICLVIGLLWAILRLTLWFSRETARPATLTVRVNALREALLQDATPALGWELDTPVRLILRSTLDRTGHPIDRVEYLIGSDSREIVRLSASESVRFGLGDPLESAAPMSASFFFSDENGRRLMTASGATMLNLEVMVASEPRRPGQHHRIGVPRRSLNPVQHGSWGGGS